MEPVTYEQIVRELAVKRGLKPWEIAMSQETAQPAVPQPQTMPAAGPTVDPMALAQQREKINQALAPMGDIANPETVAARRGNPPKPGLLQLLMSLMAR